MAASLTQFIEDLLVKAGLTNLPSDFREPYVKKLASQLEERIGLRALQELDEEGLADFESLVKNKQDSAAVFDYFTRHVRDFPKKMQQVMDEFAAEFVSHSRTAKETLRRPAPEPTQTSQPAG